MNSRCLIKRFFWALFLCGVLISLNSWAGDRSLGEVIDDGVITNTLKIKFMKDEVVKAKEIDIDTYKGVVSLYGGVDSQEQINRAIEIAEMQAGVKEVKSYLTIKDAEHDSGEPSTPTTRPSHGSGVLNEKDLSN